MLAYATFSSFLNLFSSGKFLFKLVEFFFLKFIKIFFTFKLEKPKFLLEFFYRTNKNASIEFVHENMHKKILVLIKLFNCTLKLLYFMIEM